MLVGFHIQQSPNHYLNAVRELAPGSLVKFTSGWERAIETKAANPLVKVWVRHVVKQPMPTSNYEQVARDYFKGMIDQHAPLWRSVDYIQGWNEFYAESQKWDEKKHWVATDIAFAKVWHEEWKPIFPHIRFITSESPVGNSIPWQVAEGAIRYDAILGYHPYTPVLNKQLHPPDEWRYYSGRWTAMDEVYRSKGFLVDWAFGEMGPYQSAITGWRHPVVLNRNMAAYKEKLRYWIEKTRSTLAYQQGRVLGGVLFTCGAPGGGPNWSYFDHNTDEMKEIAVFVRDVMSEEPIPPIDPPVEPPDNAWRDELWQKSIELQTIQLNPTAALQQAIARDGYVPVESEFWHVSDGVEYAAQAAEHLVTGGRRVYYAIVPHWNRVLWFSQLELQYYPTDSRYVTQNFGENFEVYKEKFNLDTGHPGIDYGTEIGEAVYATATGTVLRAEMDESGYGNHIRIDHGNGYVTIYAHLSRMAAHVGQNLVSGSLIGFTGNTGFSDGPHLHYEIRHWNTPIDPAPFLAAIQV